MPLLHIPLDRIFAGLSHRIFPVTDQLRLLATVTHGGAGPAHNQIQRAIATLAGPRYISAAALSLTASVCARTGTAPFRLAALAMDAPSRAHTVGRWDDDPEMRAVFRMTSADLAAEFGAET